MRWIAKILAWFRSGDDLNQAVEVAVQRLTASELLAKANTGSEDFFPDSIPDRIVDRFGPFTVTQQEVTDYLGEVIGIVPAQTIKQRGWGRTMIDREVPAQDFRRQMLTRPEKAAREIVKQKVAAEVEKVGDPAVRALLAVLIEAAIPPVFTAGGATPADPWSAGTYGVRRPV